MPWHSVRKLFHEVYQTAATSSDKPEHMWAALNTEVKAEAECNNSASFLQFQVTA